MKKSKEPIPKEKMTPTQRKMFYYAYITTIISVILGLIFVFRMMFFGLMDQSLFSSNYQNIGNYLLKDLFNLITLSIALVSMIISKVLWIKLSSQFRDFWPYDKQTP